MHAEVGRSGGIPAAGHDLSEVRAKDPAVAGSIPAVYFQGEEAQWRGRKVVEGSAILLSPKQPGRY